MNKDVLDTKLRKSCETKLVRGTQALGLSLSDKQHNQLLDYVLLLHKWNLRFNLTAVKEAQAMVSRHLLDSLSIGEYLWGDEIIDVGTGAGLPGIPLSIVYPHKQFILLDSNQKKQVFVSQAIKMLSLENVGCVCDTVQTYQSEQKFSTILTRAFAPLPKMITLTAHLCSNEGRFLAMMGKAEQDVLSLPPGFCIERVVELNVPGESAQRHLTIVAHLVEKE